MITIRNYTNEELEYIQNNYNTMTVRELAVRLNKTFGSMNNAIRKLGLIKQIHNKWTKEENKYLEDNYNTLTADYIAKKLNRTVTSVFSQVDRLGLGKQFNWTQKDIDYLKNNFNLLSHAEIAKNLNRTTQAVTAKCFDLNLYKKELPWEDWELDFVKESYMEMCTEDIAKILNRTNSAIKIKARKMGLKKYPYYCDYHFFDNIDTEEKAYWLGFLTADGWINKNDKNNAGVVGVELQYGDIGHLIKFNKSLHGNYRITDRWRKCNISSKENKNHTCIIRIFSLIMYESLLSIGFTNNKSFDGTIPKLRNDLIRHFIRGYFDGNGCLTVTNKSFNIGFRTASKDINDGLIKLISSECISIKQRSYVTEYGTTMYNPSIYKISDKIKFLKYIYEDSSIYLDRKYKKYLKAIQKYNN